MNRLLLTLIVCLLAFAAPSMAQTPASRPARQSAPVTAGRSPVAAPAGPALLDVNSADAKALDALPGVGPARAKAIVANRPYLDKQEMLTKKVLPANVFADIQDRIALVNVNTATAAFMAKILPNVGPVRAQQIVDKRPYATVQDLVGKGALTQGVLNGLKNLITTGS
jgi:DNA uptake protein ComE-like DNA-binding protein